MRAAVRIEELRLAFAGRALLDNFTLRVAEGGWCTITGPSGCGKSTLLRCLLGFSTPEAGRVEVLGTPVLPPAVWELRRRIAWVPQEPELGDGTASAFLEGMLRYRANRGLTADGAVIGEWARRLLLEPATLGQPVSQLSGGEKQRVAIVAALLLARPVLLLDEPFSALDTRSRGAVLGALLEQQATVVCVSHQPVGAGERETVVPLGEAW